MTRKLAEFSGSISVLSASLVLILAILIPPFSQSSTIKVPSHTRTGEVSLEQTEEAPEPSLARTAPIPEKEDLSPEINEIYSAPAASLSYAVYGLNEEAEAQKNAKWTSSVLAANQSVSHFSVTAPVTSEEYDLILYCVGHETRSGSLSHKVLITEVIFNRVQGAGFGSTVKDVVLSPGQFNVMDHYQGFGDWTPDETTVQAVNLVLSGSAPDYAQGAVYFCNPYLVGEGNWFDMTRPVVCEIEGHRFYK